MSTTKPAYRTHLAESTNKKPIEKIRISSHSMRALPLIYQQNSLSAQLIASINRVGTNLPRTSPFKTEHISLPGLSSGVIAADNAAPPAPRKKTA